MKKAVAMVLTLCLCAAVFAGCSGGKSLSVTPAELADRLAAQVGFSDQMSKVENRTFYALYHVEESMVSQAAAYMSTGATAEEIAVVKATDTKNIAAIEQAMKERVESQKTGFENYVPAELEKLSRPVIKTVGDTVILCISDHNDQAERIISGAIK